MWNCQESHHSRWDDYGYRFTVISKLYIYCISPYCLSELQVEIRFGRCVFAVDVPSADRVMFAAAAVRSDHLVFEEAFELSASDGVLQLLYGFCLDLAYSLAGDLENPADLFQRVGISIADSVAQLDNLALAI